jgi:hypothetical protein
LAAASVGEFWDDRPMAPDRSKTGDEPHDVLAAEEYAVPAPDPGLHREGPHDVLAAEEYAVPAPDPGLHHGPVRLPDDPTGIAEPHDVLAAEEFALPAPPPGAHGPSAPSARSVRRGAVAAGGLAALVALRLRKRHS